MYLRHFGTVVTVVGYRGIVGWSGIETLGVVGDLPAALVKLNFTRRP